MTFPLNDEIAAAFAQFFFGGGSGPSHSTLSRLFAGAGYVDADPYDLNTQAPNKQQRVLAVFRAAERRPAGALVDGMLNALRLDGAFGKYADDKHVADLHAAVTHAGWALSAYGRLEYAGDIHLETGGRAALDEQLERLRRNIDDPAALLGGAKELLEAVAKFVLEEGNRLPERADFPALVALSFEKLGLRPAVVDDSVPGAKQVPSIYQSAKTVAFTVNELRNLQGTGHGRTLLTGVTAEAARYVIREVVHVADLMLSTHDRQIGR
ncbi:abortive infection family protein [Microbacterium sp. NPDC028030]|uniref:abortive infection family protein n=1 Tax=Microbacterium sp. NPDC028030 TaxID=3155124 RepID=UPI00340BD33A